MIRISLHKKALIVFGSAISLIGILNAQNNIVLNISKAKDTISKDIYGHFAKTSDGASMEDFMLERAIQKFLIKMEYGLILLKLLKN